MIKSFYQRSLLPSFFLLLAVASSCTKEKEYIYEVNPVQVQSAGGGKNTPKTNAEFITIAYADLFGTQIPQQGLLRLSILYDAMGDKKLIEDRILLNMLSQSNVQIPSVRMSTAIQLLLYSRPIANYTTVKRMPSKCII